MKINEDVKKKNSNRELLENCKHILLNIFFPFKVHSFFSRCKCIYCSYPKCEFKSKKFIYTLKICT